MRESKWICESTLPVIIKSVFEACLLMMFSLPMLVCLELTLQMIVTDLEEDFMQDNVKVKILP